MNKNIFIKRNSNSEINNNSDNSFNSNSDQSRSSETHDKKPSNKTRPQKNIDAHLNPTELLNTESRVSRYINKLNANMNNLKSCQNIIVILIDLLNTKEDETEQYKVQFQAAIELLEIKKRENEKLKKKLKKYSYE